MKYKYETEAIEFIKQLPKFNLDAFEKWVNDLVLQIGSNQILQYLSEKQRWNNSCLLIDSKLKCDFSKQAKNLIGQMDSFDKDECIIWFSNALKLTKGDIQNYLDQLR